MFYKILSSSGSYVTGQNQVNHAIQGKSRFTTMFSLRLLNMTKRRICDTRAFLQMLWQYCCALVGALAFWLQVKASWLAVLLSRWEANICTRISDCFGSCSIFYNVHDSFQWCAHWLVIILKEYGGDTTDCSNLGSSAHPISADINMEQRFHSDARYILVIEKVPLSEVVRFSIWLD